MPEFEVTLFESVMRKIKVDAESKNEARQEALKQIPNSHIHWVEEKK